MHTYNISVLIVEDDYYKGKAISDFFLSEWQGASICVARSLNSAIKRVCEVHFDLALVDMSLPTYDLASDAEGGGDPEGFAGEDIMRFIESESPSTKIVVITQLSEFSDGSVTRDLDELTSSLRKEFGENYLGLVSYLGRHGVWRDNLKKIIQDAGFK